MKRSTLITLALIVALGIAAVLVLQRPGEQSIIPNEAATLVQYDSLAIDRMTISGHQGNVVIEKQAGKWMLVEPLSYRADDAAVSAAVAKGASIRLAGLISSNPEKQGLFQVDSAATLVTMSDRGTEKAAFRVGKPGSSFTETYVRREGSPDVYLTPEVLTYVFSRSVKDWRDKSIFNTGRSAIRSIRYRYGDTTFVLTRTDSLWQIDGQTIGEPAVTPLLTTLSALQTDEFVDSALTAPPPLSAVVEVDGVQIRFYENKGTSRYYVQTSASPQWFELQPWRAQQVLKRKAELLAS